MKGQYLAVESVLTFGLGIMAAVGVISIMDSYSSGIYDTSESLEAKMVQQEIVDNMNKLRPVEGEAHVDIELADGVANSDYEVVADESLIINVQGKDYQTRIPVQDQLEGSGSGDIRLSKNHQEFQISDR